METNMCPKISLVSYRSLIKNGLQVLQKIEFLETYLTFFQNPNWL